MKHIYYKALLKHMMKLILKEKDIKAKIISTQIKNYSIEYQLNIKCPKEEIEKIHSYLLSVYKAIDIIGNLNQGIYTLDIVIEKVPPLKYAFYGRNMLGLMDEKRSIEEKTGENRSIDFDKLKYLLILGYDWEGKPIFVNMNTNAHLLISGLSGNGKSCCVRAMIEQLEHVGADVIIINGYKEDYPNHKGRFITNAKEFIASLYDNLQYHNTPLYLVLEEMQTFDNKTSELLKKLLSIGRHYNMFIIGVIQEATKENCKFKSLFNARCTFKQVDSSSIQVVLGCSIDKALNKQELALLSDGLYYGRTFTI